MLEGSDRVALETGCDELDQPPVILFLRAIVLTSSSVSTPFASISSVLA